MCLCCGSFYPAVRTLNDGNMSPGGCVYVPLFAHLDVFQEKRLFAVLAVERSLGTLALVVALLLVGPHQLFTRGTENDLELTVPLMAGLRAYTNTTASQYPPPSLPSFLECTFVSYHLHSHSGRLYPEPLTISTFV